LWIEIQCL